jgi:ribosome maturation factor RimP
MAVTDRITTLITPTLAGMGYEIVRVQLNGSRKNPTLQIMAERQDGAAMGVEDCTVISQTVSAQLDVADPIASAYTLEVSSPGLERPLTRLKDFERFAGHTARVQLRDPREGRRNFQGILRGCAGEDIQLELDAGQNGGKQESITLPFAAVETARLVMSEALLRQALNNKA